MQVKYTGTLLEDGHLSIPKKIIDKLKIDRKTKVYVILELEKKPKKDKILAYAGLLSDLKKDEETRFNDSVRRRSFFGKRKVEI